MTRVGAERKGVGEEALGAVEERCFLLLDPHVVPLPAAAAEAGDVILQLTHSPLESEPTSADANYGFRKA